MRRSAPRALHLPEYEAATPPVGLGAHGDKWRVVARSSLGGLHLNRYLLRSEAKLAIARTTK